MPETTCVHEWAPCAGINRVGDCFFIFYFLFFCLCLCECVGLWGPDTASLLPRVWSSACVSPVQCSDGLHLFLSWRRRASSALCASTRQESTPLMSSVSFVSLTPLPQGTYALWPRQKYHFNLLLKNFFKNAVPPHCNWGFFFRASTDCSGQDEQFSLIFTIASFMNNFLTLPSGFLFDNFGTTVARLCAMWVQQRQQRPQWLTSKKSLVHLLCISVWQK